MQYGLPHPISWLSSQPTKLQVKKAAKAGVLEDWLGTLRTKASYLSSLKYLRPQYLGLTKCHPIFTSCGSSPWEVEMATTQARMISGRYRVEALSGHWTPWNRDGLCTLPECWGTEASHRGTIESMLMSCSSLSSYRADLMEFCWTFLSKFPKLTSLVKSCLDTEPIQFWLDCFTMSAVISARQCEGDWVLYPLFKVTRNFCHVLHSARISLLSRD